MDDEAAFTTGGASDYKILGDAADEDEVGDEVDGDDHDEDDG